MFTPAAKAMAEKLGLKRGHDLSGWSAVVVKTVLFLAAVLSCLAMCAEPATTLTDDEIKVMLRDSIELDRQTVGLAVGIVDQQGARVVCHGTLDNGTDRYVDGDTLFAIGSITKVFTALLLQDMVERGEMRLDDPVQKYLPESVRMPTFRGRQITLLHLATHTSALPRDYSGNLYSFLSNCKLQRAPGTQKEYSNLGVGLLGHLIARKAGMDYESLVLERICRPLGMNDTCITVPPDLKSRCAAAHAMPGHRVRDSSPTHHDTNALAPTLYGAGSIRSTANDLLKFVSAYAGLTTSPLSSTMRRAMEFHVLESGDKRRLVWESDGEVFEHGGLLEGYQAELALDVKKRRGVVVLSNCANVGPLVPAIWRRLLEGNSPSPAQIMKVNQTLYDDYAGLYEFEGGELCTVRHDGNRLMFQLLGTPGHRLRDSSFEIFPQSQELFCNEFWQVQIRFVPAVAAQQPGLVLGSHKSVRSSAEIPPPPAVIRADPTVYNGYVGKYRKTFLLGLIRIGPTLSIAHKADDLGSHLFASVRGMGTEEIFPTSKTCFVPGYNVSDDLRFTFVQNKKGTTKRVIVLWNGKKYSGNRISKEVS